MKKRLTCILSSLLLGHLILGACITAAAQEPTLTKSEQTDFTVQLPKDWYLYRIQETAEQSFYEYTDAHRTRFSIFWLPGLQKASPEKIGQVYLKHYQSQSTEDSQPPPKIHPLPPQWHGIKYDYGTRVQFQMGDITVTTKVIALRRPQGYYVLLYTTVSAPSLQPPTIAQAATDERTLLTTFTPKN